MFEHFAAGDRLRAVALEFSGQQIVKLEAHTVVRPFPPGVGRHDEWQRADQVRRVLQEQAALAQRFAHQRKVPLPQITKPAVNEFGAAAGGGFGKITLFHQHRSITPRGGLHGRAQTCRPSADHQEIPMGGRFANSFERFVAIHALAC